MALQGTLDTFALPDVLRLLAATAKTGRLQIDGDRGIGEVWLDHGGVVGGAVDALAPETSDVIFELLRHEKGSFEFVADDVSGHEPVDVDHVLGEAEAKLADWRVVEAVVPSLAFRVELVDELPQDEVAVTRERWHTLVAIGEGRTIADLDRRLALGEVKVSEAVKALVDDGIVAIHAPAVEEPAEAPVVEDDHEDPVAVDDAEPELRSVPLEDWDADAAFDAIVIPDLDAGHDVLPDDAAGAIVFDIDPEAEQHSVMATDAAPPVDEVTDFDEVVRAEVDTDGDSALDSDTGGSREVDLDASLDAHPDSHAYLTAAEGPEAGDPTLGANGGKAMPEPLPASDPLPSVDPVAADLASEVSAAVPFPQAADVTHDDVSGAIDHEGWTTPPAGRVIPPEDAAEVTRHLSQLSPKAARAIAAAANGTVPAKDAKDGRDKDAKEGKAARKAKPDEPMNRNLLMKFISSK